MRRGAVKIAHIVVIILILMAVFIPYTIGQSKIADENKTLQKLYSYGDRVLSYISNSESTKLQNEILVDGHHIDLEQVALFVDTVSVETDINRHKWEGYKSTDGNITIYGSIKDEANPQKMDMMLIKKGNKLLVKAIHIGNQKIESKNREFPLNDDYIDDLNDDNISEIEGL